MAHCTTALLAGAALSLVASAASAEMTLTSTDIAEGETMSADQEFDGFGCSGGNLSPALSWSGAPAGTNSYIVMAYDPDAPTGSGFWHWAAFNIPADVTSLPTGVGTDGVPLPDGMVQARNDYSVNAFGGACPPEGDDPHHYIFTVYAMPQESLPLDETASSAVVGFMAHTTSLDHASLTALYGR